MTNATTEQKTILSALLPAGPKLNLGCGPVQPPGWVNIDGSNRAWLASKLPLVDGLLTRFGLLSPTEHGAHTKYWDLAKSLPYADSTVSCIYSGEMWEHFEYDAAHRLTGQCYRALAPGGVLRVCVPDGPTFWHNYLKKYDQVMALPRRQRDGQILYDHVKMYFDDICTRRRWLGSMGHTHKWQYDEVQLIEMFEANGFAEVERQSFHHSRIPGIEAVERADFLIVEGVKVK